MITPCAKYFKQMHIKLCNSSDLYREMDLEMGVFASEHIILMNIQFG